MWTINKYVNGENRVISKKTDTNIHFQRKNAPTQLRIKKYTGLKDQKNGVKFARNDD